MIYYFSGSPALGDFGERMVEACDFRLLSCHYQSAAHRWLKVGKYSPLSPNREILLDSGAFSAWSLGQAVRLPELMRKYDELIQQYGDYYNQFWLINLDVIPGSKGVDPTPQEIDEATYQSDLNYEKLQERYGDCVLPVFHQGESYARLEEVIKQNPNYICVSPRNDVPEKARREWSQLIHSKIGGRVHTHGLATTGDLMMKRVPWFSVDSATWVMIAAMGQVTLHIGDRLRNITVSVESDKSRVLNDHVESLPAKEKDVIVAAIESCDVDFETACTDPAARCYINIVHMHRYVNTMKQDILPAQETLF